MSALDIALGRVGATGLLHRLGKHSKDKAVKDYRERILRVNASFRKENVRPETPPRTTISSISITTQNIAKKPPLPFILHHFHRGSHVVALQEVNSNVDDLRQALASSLPGALIFGQTNGQSQGSLLVIHPLVASFARPPTEPGTPPLTTARVA